MKKILCLILAHILCFSLCSCRTQTDENYEENSTQKEGDEGFFNSKSEDPSFEQPTSFMDMFKGERKIWLWLDDYKAKHNSLVVAILAIENSKITEGYFTDGLWNGKDIFLSNFDGMTDEEILDYARENGYDISQKHEINSYLWVGPTNLPKPITYSGELNDSGNALKREFIRFLDGEGNSSFSISDLGNISFIQPTTIKNEEYIGILDSIGSECLVTRNIFGEITSLDLDDAAGAAETW